MALEVTRTFVEIMFQREVISSARGSIKNSSPIPVRLCLAIPAAASVVVITFALCTWFDVGMGLVDGTKEPERTQQPSTLEEFRIQDWVEAEPATSEEKEHMM